jgi:hypothetical protein
LSAAALEDETAPLSAEQRQRLKALRRSGIDTPFDTDTLHGAADWTRDKRLAGRPLIRVSEPGECGIDWGAVADEPELGPEPVAHPLASSRYAPPGVPYLQPRFESALAVHKWIDRLSFWGVIAFAAHLGFGAGHVMTGVAVFVIAPWFQQQWAKSLQQRFLKLSDPIWEWPEVAVAPEGAPVAWTISAIHNALIAYEDLLDDEADLRGLDPAALRIDIRRDVQLEVNTFELAQVTRPAEDPDEAPARHWSEALSEFADRRLCDLIEAELATRGNPSAPAVRVLRGPCDFVLLGAIPKGLDAVCEAVEAACRTLVTEMEPRRQEEAARLPAPEAPAEVQPAA